MQQQPIGVDVLRGADPVVLFLVCITGVLQESEPFRRLGADTRAAVIDTFAHVDESSTRFALVFG